MTAKRYDLLLFIPLAMLLTACGSRDAEVAESVMEAKQAALRAEAAQEAAEQAAARIGARPAPVAAAAEEEEEEEPQDAASDEFDPNSNEFDNRIVAPPEPAGPPQ